MHFPTTIYTKYSSEILRACSILNYSTTFLDLRIFIRRPTQLGFVKKSVDSKNGHRTTAISWTQQWSKNDNNQLNQPISTTARTTPISWSTCASTVGRIYAVNWCWKRTWIRFYAYDSRWHLRQRYFTGITPAGRLTPLLCIVCSLFGFHWRWVGVMIYISADRSQTSGPFWKVKINR